MKIGELIERLNEWGEIEQTSGSSELPDILFKAAETIRLLWEIARDTNIAKYKRQIDEMEGKA